ncbi:GNAT family N-acetyltransferase [Actinokineospora fastidiosa]|uniref:Lysine N-acyltransferase MbtK n=1 Tax=Actinokineospora fastidiosa TaxID=1816 RepID=A0A918GQ36_9PSEU|nr:GNAT family N-acetyltransferase [Actinokineospora fastidiosa]
MLAVDAPYYRRRVENRIDWRRVTPADFPLLAEWLAQPHVHRWWHHEFTPEAVERDFGAAARGDEPGEDWLVSVDGEPVALFQRCRVADYADEFDQLSAAVPTPLDTMTIDYLIGDPHRTGKGLGTRLIRWAVARTWTDYPDATVIIIPIVAANRASWRALEKAGARRIATVEMEPENPIDDREHHVYQFDRPVDR